VLKENQKTRPPIPVTGNSGICEDRYPKIFHFFLHFPTLEQDFSNCKRNALFFNQDKDLPAFSKKNMKNYSEQKQAFAHACLK
jgi:hypothetical protein